VERVELANMLAFEKMVIFLADGILKRAN